MQNEYITLKLNALRTLTELNSHYAYKIMMYLLDKAIENKTRILEISYNELQKEFDIGKSTVGRNLKALKDAGIIIRNSDRKIILSEIWVKNIADIIER